MEARHAADVRAIRRPALLKVGGHLHLGVPRGVEHALDCCACEVSQLIAEPLREDVCESALQTERCRMPTGEERRDVLLAENQQRGVLGDLHGHGVGAAIEQSDFADHIPRARQPDLLGAIAGAAQRGCEAAFDYDRHLSRIVPLPPKNLALSRRPPSRHVRKLGQVRLGPPFEEWDGGEKSDYFTVRHPGHECRTRAPRR